jgi:FkbM family methyltransferase
MMPSYAYWLLLIASAIVFAIILYAVTRKRHTNTAPHLLDVAAPYKLVKARYGWTLANPNDFYLGRAIIDYGEFGEEEATLLNKILAMRPGTVVEAGANAGFLTIPIAQALAANGHEMIVFEPQPFLFQNLCANLALSALNNVRAWPSACGNAETTLYFSAPSYTHRGNFGGISMEAESSQASIAVPCVRLDDVIGSKEISLIKIDVEGAELDVLNGAGRLIDTSRPIIYIENDRVEKSPALIQWLMDKNYRLWWHGPRLFNANNFFRNANNIYGDTISANMVCFPAEREIPEIAEAEIKDIHSHPFKRNVPQQA